MSDKIEQHTKNISNNENFMSNGANNNNTTNNNNGSGAINLDMYNAPKNNEHRGGNRTSSNGKLLGNQNRQKQ